MAQNLEKIVLALEEFRKSFEDAIFHTPSEDDDSAKEAISKVLVVPDILNEYTRTIAKTGRVEYSWNLVKPLFLTKLDWVMHDYNTRDNFDEVPLMPNSPQDSFKDLYRTIMSSAYSFTQAPFTVQRLFELISSPELHYRRIDKFMRALEKTLNIVTTVDAQGRKLAANGMLPPAPIINGRPSEKLPVCLSAFYRWLDSTNNLSESATDTNGADSNGAPRAMSASPVVESTLDEHIDSEPNDKVALMSGRSLSAETETVSAETNVDDLSISSLDEVPSISDEVIPTFPTCLQGSTQSQLLSTDKAPETDVFLSESSNPELNDEESHMLGDQPSMICKRPRDSSDISEELESEKKPKLGSGAEAGDAEISNSASCDSSTEVTSEPKRTALERLDPNDTATGLQESKPADLPCESKNEASVSVMSESNQDTASEVTEPVSSTEPMEDLSENTHPIDERSAEDQSIIEPSADEITNQQPMGDQRVEDQPISSHSETDSLDTLTPSSVDSFQASNEPTNDIASNHN